MLHWISKFTVPVVGPLSLHESAPSSLAKRKLIKILEGSQIQFVHAEKQKAEPFKIVQPLIGDTSEFVALILSNSQNLRAPNFSHLELHKGLVCIL
jgi:hypothetical protein